MMKGAPAVTFGMVSSRDVTGLEMYPANSAQARFWAGDTKFEQDIDQPVYAAYGAELIQVVVPPSEG